MPRSLVRHSLLKSMGLSAEGVLALSSMVKLSMTPYQEEGGRDKKITAVRFAPNRGVVNGGFTVYIIVTVTDRTRMRF